MSGIARIAGAREALRTPVSDQPLRREVWFKDGDQAFVSSVATGEEGDNKLDELYLYTYRSGTRWINLLSDEGIDTSVVPENYRPSHKFAFWTYVHEILHGERRVDDWEEIAGPGGKKMYKEEVNDFRIISLGFGRSDYIWNQLVDVYNDWGSLNKGVIRIRRTGSGMYDTSYSLAATARDAEIPSDKLADIEELPDIKDYFRERYGGVPEYSNNGTVDLNETPATTEKAEKQENLF